METVHGAVSMIVLAVVTGALAVGILYARWRKWTTFRGVLLVVAGALAVTSLIFWMKVSGPEFGAAFALINAAIAAWFFVLTNAEVRQKKELQQILTAASIPSIRSIARHSAIFLVAVPLAGVASTLASIAISGLLPWNEIDRAVFPLITVPIVWGCVAFWVCADPKLWRPTLSLFTCGGVSAAALFI